MHTTSRPGAPFGQAIEWARVHPLATDVALAVLVGTATTVGYFSADVIGSERDHDLVGLAIIIVQTAAFAARRVAPLRSFVVVIVATLAFWTSDYATDFDVFSLLATYAVVAHGGADRRRVWTVAGSGVTVLTVVALLGVLVPSEDLPAVAVFGIAMIHLTAAVIGEVVQSRRFRLAELEDRALRAETEHELLARQAVLDERSRIARDLHDVVAHGMSVMIVQAGAAERVVTTYPDQAAESLRTIQRTGREALAEMRRMLGVLRDEHEREAALTPQPGLDDLGQIVQRCDDVGVATRLEVRGERPTRAVGPEMAGYRVVQEALTNVIKHAGRPVQVLVKITWSADHMRLEIDDDGDGATLAQVARSTGHGLVGMRERVELYGGTLHAGSRPGGGFRVSAVIPFDAPVPGRTATPSSATGQRVRA